MTLIDDLLTRPETLERRLQSELEARGGRAPFPALFDLQGNLIAARQIRTRRTLVWGIMKNDSLDSEIVSWFAESQAKKGSIARRHDARKGYYVGYVLAPARVEISGKGSTSHYAQIVRTDGGFSRDVEIIDNKPCNGFSIRYGLVSEIGHYDS